MATFAEGLTKQIISLTNILLVLLKDNDYLFDLFEFLYVKDDWYSVNNASGL